MPVFVKVPTESDFEGDVIPEVVQPEFDKDRGGLYYESCTDAALRLIMRHAYRWAEDDKVGQAKLVWASKGISPLTAATNLVMGGHLFSKGYAVSGQMLAEPNNGVSILKKGFEPMPKSGEVGLVPGLVVQVEDVPQATIELYEDPIFRTFYHGLPGWKLIQNNEEKL